MSNADGTNEEGTNEEEGTTGPTGSGTQPLSPIPTSLVDDPELLKAAAEIDLDEEDIDPEEAAQLAAIEAEMEAGAEIEAGSANDALLPVSNAARVDHNHSGMVAHLHLLVLPPVDPPTKQPAPEMEKAAAGQQDVPVPDANPIPLATPPSGGGNGGGGGGAQRAFDDYQEPRRSESEGSRFPKWIWWIIALIAAVVLIALATKDGCGGNAVPPVIDDGSGEVEEVIVVPIPPVIEEVMVDVCPVSPSFDELDESLQEYWRAFGPQEFVSCSELELGVSHVACLEYGIWVRNVRNCRFSRAARHAGETIQNAGLN